MPKFPPIVYVKWDDGDQSAPYLVADATLTAMAESDPVRVGIYRLHEEVDLRTVEEIRRKGTRRWFR